MKKVLALALGLAVTAPPAATAVAADEEASRGPCVVPFDEGADLDILKGLIMETIDVEDDVFIHDMLAVRVLWLQLTPSECLELQDSPIEGVTGAFWAPEVAVAPDPLADELSPTWPFNPVPDGMEGGAYGGAQVIPTGYTRVGAVAEGDYSDVDVAVVDTGVDQFHDDLNVVGGFDCTDPQNGEDNWGHDGFGHGTHVAGIIGALDNDRGIIGVAPGARIWSYKVLGNDGSGSFASVLCGVNAAIENGSIELANLSLGGQTAPTPLWGADPFHNGFGLAAQAGITVVVSAGNSGIDSINSAPANYAESVVTVSALTDYDGQAGGLSAPPGNIPAEYKDDHKALFSNYGSVVDFIAPGVDNLSTIPLNTYGRASGTSMAAPHVTGVFAAHIAECGQESRELAVERVTAWSSQAGWTVRSGWDGDVGPDHEPLIRFGAPCDLELKEEAE